MLSRIRVPRLPAGRLCLSVRRLRVQAQGEPYPGPVPAGKGCTRGEGPLRARMAQGGGGGAGRSGGSPVARAAVKSMHACRAERGRSGGA